jgi:hypothetical protein
MLTSRTRACVILPFTTAASSTCPADWESYLTLICQLESWMPESCHFCHQCLLYRPAINFANSTGSALDLPAGTKRSQLEEEGREEDDTETDERMLDFCDMQPRIRFDCERSLPSHLGKQRASTCICGKISTQVVDHCTGCLIFNLAQQGMHEDAVAYELEDVEPEARGPWAGCCSRCCD